ETRRPARAARARRRGARQDRARRVVPALRAALVGRAGAPRGGGADRRRRDRAGPRPAGAPGWADHRARGRGAPPPPRPRRTGGPGGGAAGPAGARAAPGRAAGA
ncbi:MAG: hypothetical protein AVDCRST_MAG54-2718, partial [uncultured Actinomycetospora sp.]